VQFVKSALILCYGGLVTGCSVDTPEPLVGEVRLNPAMVDFGPVAVNDAADQLVLLENHSGAPITIRQLDLEPGPYQVRLPQGSIPAGQAREVRVRFTPSAPGEAISQSKLHTSDKALVLTLTGTGVQPSLLVRPSELSFDAVVLGTTAAQSLELENIGEAALLLEFKALFNLEPCDAAARTEAFCMAPSGPISLAPGESAALRLEFRPRDTQTIERGRLRIEGCPGCGADIDLWGRGLTHGLTCSPATLAFGDIKPGGCGVLALQCDNAANQRVTLGETRFVGDPNFFIELPTPALVEPGEVITASVSFCPDMEGPASGSLSISTDQAAPGQELVTALVGRGGGPHLVVRPSEIDFGLSVVGAPIQRNLWLQNTGDRDLVLSAATGLNDTPVQTTAGLSIAPGMGAVLTVIAAPSEGAWQGILRLDSNDRDSPSDVVVRGEAEALGPCTYESTAHIDFGAGEAHRPEVGFVQVVNRGPNECLIYDVAFAAGSDPALSLPHPPTLPVRVPAGSEWHTPVEMITTSTGSVQGALLLRPSSPDEPLAEVSLQGLGAATGFFPSSPTLDFGALPLNCAYHTQTLRLWSKSLWPPSIIELTGLRVEGDGFSLVQGPDLSQGPLTPESGDGVDVVIGLAARPMTTSVGTLVVDTIIGGQPVTQRVPLIGRGLDAPRVQERFVQLERDAVDLLFAIDFSGCVTKEQFGLADNFEALMRLAQVERLNYQIGVTTTAVTMEAGRLMYPDRIRGNEFAGRPEDKLITARSLPDPETLYSRALQARYLAGGGAADESGLGALYLALHPLMLVGHNAGLLRRQAHLGVLLMTDEPDQTSRRAGSPADDLDFYLDYYRAMKGVDGKSAFTAVGIAGDPVGGCDGPGGSASAAPRVAELADRAAGAFESVCSQDWTATASALSGPLVGERTAFFLTQAPDLATVEVDFDGMPIPRSGPGQAGWVYQPSDRSLRFDAFWRPEPGAEIVVRYVPACPEG